MSISTQVDNDIKDAMRARDSLKLGALRLLKSALKTAAIEKLGAGGELPDAEAVSVIRKQVKQRQESAESYTTNGRPELAEKELAEITVLETYLPASLSAEQLQSEVATAIADSGASGSAAMGAVMKILKDKIGDQVDGKTLSAEVKRQLAG